MFVVERLVPVTVRV
jgi:hypothetical protein